MRMINSKLAALPCAALLVLAGCDVNVEEKGEMPEIDIQADSGQMPEYQVEQTQEGKMPSVDVDAEPGKLPEVEVRGPDVDVGVEPVTVPVPDVDVDLPEEQEE